MEVLGLLVGIVVLGYLVFLLVLPSVLRGFSRRLSRLEATVQALQHRLSQSAYPVDGQAPGPQAEAVEESPAPGNTAESAAAQDSDKAEALHSASTGELSRPMPETESMTSEDSAPAARRWTAPKGPATPPAWQPPFTADVIARIKAWLLGGNTVARVGVIVLLFGFAFLLR